MRKEDIAASLEIAFSQHGFAEPSVAQLKTLCGVSLRTLYKYYPSKEAMIVAALEFRHARYLNFLKEGIPSNGADSLLHVFDRLKNWMHQYAPHGCMSMSAIAAFPDNSLIKSAVKDHKADIRQFLGDTIQNANHSTELYLLHEGVSSAWPLLGDEAVESAKHNALRILEEN